MPLFRAIGRFLQRRMNVEYPSGQYADVVRAEWRGDLGGGGSMSGGIAGFVVMLVMVPAFVFLVLVGLIYEVLIRLTFHKLPRLSDWTLSVLAAIAVVVVGIRWLLPQ